MLSSRCNTCRLPLTMQNAAAKAQTLPGIGLLPRMRSGCRMLLVANELHFRPQVHLCITAAHHATFAYRSGLTRDDTAMSRPQRVSCLLQ